MKISLVSDVHLEFGPLQLPGGEVLILAGDICEYRSFKKELPSVVNFFKDECAKYEQVFMVAGNHESYRYRLDKTYASLKELLPNNVILLENETVDYRGVVFMGATLWTDLNKNNPLTVQVVKTGMNDYRVIQNHYPTGHYYKLTPEHTYQLHKNTIDYFKTSLAEYQNREVVVITHHAPSYQSIHERFRSDHHMNGAYASDLSEFILDHPQIKLWTMGHTHNIHRYYVGNTLITCNPRGYAGWDSDADRFKLRYIDLDNMPKKFEGVDWDWET